MDRSQIYREWSWAYLEIRPTDRSDAIGRKVDAGRKKHSKKAYFSRLLVYWANFPAPYQLNFSNEGKGHRVTSLM